MIGSVSTLRFLGTTRNVRFRGNADRQYERVFAGENGYGSMKAYNIRSTNFKYPFIVRSATKDAYLGEVLQQYGIHQGDPVLELGCNNGNNLIPLAQNGLEMYGVDLADQRLAEIEEKAKEKGIAKRVHTAQWDFAEAGELPWPELKGKVKAMYAVHVFSHLSDERLIQTMQQLKRYLAPGAPVVATFILKDQEGAEPTDDLAERCKYGEIRHSHETILKAFKGMRLNRALSRKFQEQEGVYPGLETVKDKLHWYVFENTPEPSQTPWEGIIA